MRVREIDRDSNGNFLGYGESIEGDSFSSIVRSMKEQSIYFACDDNIVFMRIVLERITHCPMSIILADDEKAAETFLNLLLKEKMIEFC